MAMVNVVTIAASLGGSEAHPVSLVRRPVAVRRCCTFYQMNEENSRNTVLWWQHYRHRSAISDYYYCYHC